MSVLFYSERSEKAGKIVQKMIEDQASGEQIEICRTVKDLSNRLRRPRYDLILMVLLISSPEKLMDVILIHDLLADIPIILILPDRKKETIAKAHKLYPRFLSYIDGNFSDVALVLNQMLNYARFKEKRYGS